MFLMFLRERKAQISMRTGKAKLKTVNIVVFQLKHSSSVEQYRGQIKVNIL